MSTKQKRTDKRNYAKVLEADHVCDGTGEREREREEAANVPTCAELWAEEQLLRLPIFGAEEQEGFLVVGTQRL